MSASPMPEDRILPFQIDNRSARGRLVRLNDSVDAILAGHDYPVPVARLLGELVTMTALLAGMLKFEGVFTMQIKGNGPVSMMVADMTSDGNLRGFAQFDAEALAQAAREAEKAAGLDPENNAEGRRVAELMDHSIPVLLESGYLAFTVDQGPHTQRYQGIVSLEGETLSECITHYFEQSDQLQTVIRTAVGLEQLAGGRNRWRAGGVLLQRMPEEGGKAPEDQEHQGGGAAFSQVADDAPSAPDAQDSDTEEDPLENWNRAAILMQSCKDVELLDDSLGDRDLLWRLFHEDGVRVWEASSLRQKCRCSREKLENVLAGMPRTELQDMLDEKNEVIVDCEFCNSHYVFTAGDLDRLCTSE